MIQVSVQIKQTTKQYIRSLPTLYFNSLLELIWALFENYQPRTKNWIKEAFLFLKAYGVEDFSDIKDYEIHHLIQVLRSDKKTYALIFDSEKLTYILLAGIVSGHIQVLIDNTSIDTINQPITLLATSTITFLDLNDISLLQFNTI